MKIYGKEPSPIEKPKEYVPEAKKKADKPAAAAAPAAAAPKKEKKPAAAADDDDEPAAPAEPKAKHPCEALGKASMVLDDWKRKYSNEDTPVRAILPLARLRSPADKPFFFHRSP